MLLQGRGWEQKCRAGCLSSLVRNVVNVGVEDVMPALSARHAFHQFFLLPAAVLAGLFCYHHHCCAIMTSLEPVEITLEPVFRVTCPVEPAHNVGDSGEGVRKIVPIAPGGTITSPSQPSTGQWECMVEATTSAPTSSARPASTQDTFSNSNLVGELVDPSQYYFRLKLILECDDPDPQVQDLVCKVVIASAVRTTDTVMYQAYVVN
ncbi:hypothetical protein L1887_62338 [Cichorium endivia]|nr:hypothetical protein L1887_62338 [Cichorium endivia]